MRTMNALEIGGNFMDVCDMVASGETVVVSRDSKPKVVLVSEAEFNEMAKAHRNAEYLAKIDRSLSELEEGKGITMTFEEWEKTFCNE